MSAQVIPLIPQSEVDKAWEAYQAERVRIFTDPTLANDPAYHAECSRLFNIMMNMFRAQCGAPSNVIPFRKARA